MKPMTFLLLLAIALSACAPAVTPTPTLPAPTATVPSPTATPVPPPTATVPPPPPVYAAHGPYAVGARDFDVQGTDYTLNFTMWYPALNPDNAPEEITYVIGGGKLRLPGQAIQNATPDTAQGSYPLVIFSTSLGDFRQSSAYLCEHLASYGFVVMASDPRDDPEWAAAVNRPIDTKLTLSFADKATAPGGALDGLLDMEHIAVIGWSTGGWNALVAGGAQFHLGWCAQHPDFGNCPGWVWNAQDIAKQLGLDAVPSGLWPPMNDPRVGAVVALAPDGDIWGAEYEGVAVVKVPTLVMAGTSDAVNLPQFAAYPIYQHLGSAQKGLVKFQDGGHVIFFVGCPAPCPFGQEMAEQNWDLAQAHDLINHFATAFLLTEFTGDEQAAKALKPENVTFSRIEYETTDFEAAK